MSVCVALCVCVCTHVNNVDIRTVHECVSMGVMHAG